MDYRLSLEDDRSEAALTGRLTFNDFDRMRSLTRDLCRQAGQSVTLQSAGLEFIDSSGLGMLLILEEELRKAGKQMVLRGAHGQVRRVLTVAELGDVLNMQD
jgi:HptB-dependent secretion and biofilm anti anti-sigma factor